MTIALPTSPAPNGAQPLLRDFGGELTPFLGGPEQRINRLGTRYGIRVTMPPMRGVVSRQFVARLLRGKQENVLLEWPLLDFDTGNPGSPKVAGDRSGGTALPTRGLSPGYQVQEGQFLSIIHAGRRYMYMSTGAVTASGGGLAVLSIFPQLRTELDDNDVIELEQPMIEGRVSPGDELSWVMALEHTIGLSFSVMEGK